MPGATITEKIVSRAMGRKAKAGDLIEALPVDKLYFNEVIGPPAILNFEKDFEDVYTESGKKLQVFNPSRIAFMPDHTVPSCSIKVSQGIRLMADFAKDQGIAMYKEGDGIEHTIASEEAFVLPGEIAVATDSHTCTQGALGALAFGIGTTEGENLLATGELYSFTVPETIKFKVNGKFQRGVYAKDLVLHVLGMMGEGGASKRVAEYTGPDHRLPGHGGEVHHLQPLRRDEREDRDHEPGRQDPRLRQRGARAQKDGDDRRDARDDREERPGRHLLEDGGGRRLHDRAHRLAAALPANAKPVSQVTDPINSVFLGSCANARESDLTIAAKILKGRKVSPNTNLLVIPASRRVYNWAMDNGLLKIFADAGANIESSNCGPCFGKHMGILAPGDRCLSTSNRNYKGRMGSPEAFIYLGSPAVAAATAIEGRIADPRKYLPAGES